MSKLICTKNVKLYWGNERVVNDMRDRYFYLIHNIPKSVHIKLVGDRLDDLRSSTTDMWCDAILDCEKELKRPQPEMKWTRIKIK